MKRKLSPLSFESRALAAAELRQAKGKRIIFGRDQDVEMAPEQVTKLQRQSYEGKEQKENTQSDRVGN